MPSLYQVKTFLHHWLHEVDEHSIHSPFFYDLYSRVVLKNNKSDLPVLENLGLRAISETTHVLSPGTATGRGRAVIHDVLLPGARLRRPQDYR